MQDGETHDLRSEAESLIGWWRDAGVDVLIDEEPRNWLAEGAKKPAPVPASGVAAAESKAVSNAAPPPAAAKLVLPSTLPELLAWMAGDTEFLAAYPVRQRIAPQGNPASGIMIVTDVPERGDAASGTLLTGDEGALFDKMLAAWKIDRSGVYLASLAPARPANPILDETVISALAPILRHHIELAAPKKLWLLGEAASRAVLGMNVAEATGRLHFINYGDTKVAAIATLHPRVLLREPKAKGRVWADMQRLIGDIAE
jgi:uracil-DNA glycosylase